VVDIVNFVDLSVSIAEPGIGDNLLAVGHGRNNDSRIWTGVVFSLKTDPMYQKVQGVDGSETSTFLGNLSSIFTSGGSIEGMSGAPVFNGCRLSGMSVGMSFQNSALPSQNLSLYWLEGSFVVAVRHLLELLNYEDAKLFEFQPAGNFTMCKVPTKSYCK
jgi:hypothetical protein